MTTDQVYAALSPVSGILLYAEQRADLATAIAEYGRQICASPSDAAAGVTWYRLPADTEIEHWHGQGSDDQWSEWTAAEPRQIPEHLVAAAACIDTQIGVTIPGDPDEYTDEVAS